VTIIAFVERTFESKTAANRIIKTGMYCLRNHPVSRGLIVGALSATCIGAALTCNAAANASDDCQIGAYRFPDGEIVDIARSVQMDIRRLSLVAPTVKSNSTARKLTGSCSM
jgi:hypothetical protein